MWFKESFLEINNSAQDWVYNSQQCCCKFITVKASCSGEEWSSGTNPHDSLSKNSQCVPVYRVTQSCMTLCDPTDRGPPGSSAHGLFQARILEWVAMPSSRGSYRPRDQTHVSNRLLHCQVSSLPLSPPGVAFQKWILSTRLSLLL